MSFLYTVGIVIAVIVVWWFAMLIIDSLHSGRPMWTIAKELFKRSKK